MNRGVKRESTENEPVAQIKYDVMLSVFYLYSMELVHSLILSLRKKPII